MSDLEEYDFPAAGPPPRLGATILCWGLGIVVLAALASLAVPFFSLSRSPSNQTRAITNARQLSLALKLYAADHGGVYPDQVLEETPHSNLVFDELIKEGIVTSEAIFGSPNSVFQPDGDLATTLEGGSEQVHWAFVTRRNDASDGGSAIVFENPVAHSGTGSPAWGPPGTTDRGRSWSGPRIIIATNDGAVQTYALRMDFQIDLTKNPDPTVGIDHHTQTTEELSWVGGK